MKKNISINLFGTLYNIDDDAYTLLDNYLKSMQRCFSHQDGGEEVADDIEHRVAELLWQRREAGMEAISIEQVKEIIATIGKPEEIGGEEDGSQGEDGQDTAAFDPSDASINTQPKRKLYRCADDKMIAGVCSGLAAYFDIGSPLALRLAIVLIATLLLCFGGSVIVLLLAYVVLWVLVPETATPEDRLRMQGKKVTPENVAKQVMNDIGCVVKGSRSRKWASRILKWLLVIAVVCFSVPMLFLVLFMLASLIMFFMKGVPTALTMMCNLMGIGDMLPWVVSVRPWAIVLFGFCAFVLLLPVAGILRGIFGKKRMSKTLIVSGVVAWVLALTAGISCATLLTMSAASYSQEMTDQSRFRANKRFIQQVGWSLEESTNLNPNFTETNVVRGNLPYYTFRLRRNNRKENDGAYSAVFKREVCLPDSGTYTFMSLTESTHVDLTYTFRYTGGGEEKEVVLRPSEPGVNLRDYAYEDYVNSDFGFVIDSEAWDEFVHYGDGVVVHSIDVKDVDAGSGTVIIAAHMCMEPVEICDVKVVKK